MAEKKNATQKVERTNTGKRGSRKTKMSLQALIMMEKGAFKTLAPVNGPVWKGAGEPSLPFDIQQSKINKALGYW